MKLPAKIEIIPKIIDYVNYPMLKIMQILYKQKNYFILNSICLVILFIIQNRIDSIHGFCVPCPTKFKLNYFEFCGEQYPHQYHPNI